MHTAHTNTVGDMQKETTGAVSSNNSVLIAFEKEVSHNVKHMDLGTCQFLNFILIVLYLYMCILCIN